MNQCSETGAAAKREEALNKKQHTTAATGNTQNQDQYDLCMSQQIKDIMDLPDIGPIDLGALLQQAQGMACDELKELLYDYAQIFDVTKYMNQIEQLGNIDNITRELMKVLKKEMENARKSMTQFKIPDLSNIGVNNVLKELGIPDEILSKLPVR